MINLENLNKKYFVVYTENGIRRNLVIGKRGQDLLFSSENQISFENAVEISKTRKMPFYANSKSTDTYFLCSNLNELTNNETDDLMTLIVMAMDSKKPYNYNQNTNDRLKHIYKVANAVCELPFKPAFEEPPFSEEEKLGIIAFRNDYNRLGKKFFFLVQRNSFLIIIKNECYSCTFSI